MTTNFRCVMISVLMVIGLAGFGNLQTATAQNTEERAICELEPVGACTKDLNACQHASMCVCPAGYVYSPATGSCLFNFCATADEAAPQLSSSVEPAASNAGCVLQPSGICTTDINLCGHASICQCPNGYVYYAALGQCLQTL
jgi:hypothetical protein